MRVVISAFYKFAAVDDPTALRQRLTEFVEPLELAGSILVAPEGVNGTIAGGREAIDLFFAELRSDARFADLETKESFASYVPFRRMKVRLKREIVSLRQQVDPTALVGTYVDAADWNDVISDPDVLVIDTRNNEEVEIGTFANAVAPGTESFSQFTEYVAGLDPEQHTRVAMFCTGGIRCEKASSYLLEHGFGEVMHLKGGILKYLEMVPQSESLWHGECFVFDERVSVDHDLAPGSYTLCRGCRHSLSVDDRSGDAYEEGVSCRHCIGELDDDKRASRRERQMQEQLAQARGERHIARRDGRRGVPIGQLIDDLLWAAGSPSLVTGDEVADLGIVDVGVDIGPVDRTQVDGDALAAFVGESLPRRVGHYFERLVLFWLQHVRGVEVVGAGVQIKDGKRTVGELDFLFRDEGGALHHWEAAVKFFLHDPSGTGASHFPGPNTRDNFERKSTRLFEHQLQLSRQSHPEVSQRGALVRGRIFYHPLVDAPEALPERMADDHLQASWIRANELHLIKERWSDHVATITQKPLWLTMPIDAPAVSTSQLIDALRYRFAEADRTAMVALRDPATGVEQQRLCVVPADWNHVP